MMLEGYGGSTGRRDNKIDFEAGISLFSSIINLSSLPDCHTCGVTGVRLRLLPPMRLVLVALG